MKVEFQYSAASRGQKISHLFWHHSLWFYFVKMEMGLIWAKSLILFSYHLENRYVDGHYVTSLDYKQAIHYVTSIGYKI